jgi:hypothetical protein
MCNDPIPVMLTRRACHGPEMLVAHATYLLHEGAGNVSSDYITQLVEHISSTGQ